MRGLSPVAASGGHSSSRCAGHSLSQPLLLRSTGSRRAGSVVVAHGPSCSTACGIFPDRGSNPCPPALAGGFLTLRHQGSPWIHFKNGITVYFLSVSIYNTLFVILLVKRSFRNQVCVKGYMLNKILLGNTRKKELKTTGICKP